MEIVFWLGRFYLDGRPSEFTDMGGCPALTAAEHLSLRAAHGMLLVAPHFIAGVLL